MKFYALTRVDGGVEIMETDGDPAVCLAKWHPKRLAQIAEMREIDRAAIPLDRTFRGAWRPDLTVDMAKAREIYRNKLRFMRAPKLAALDVEYQRADERGDVAAKAEIAARKRA
jgi:hypothetical protein